MKEQFANIGKVNAAGLERDAVHIAVLPVTCAQDYLGAGQWVKLVYGTNDQVVRAEKCYGIDRTIGVIDPFLSETTSLKKGDRVLVFLQPGTITGLRHQWSHPLVDEIVPAANESEKWLREFADKWNMNYSTMIQEAQVKGGQGYTVAMGIDLHDRDELESGDEERFWYHLEKLTGFKADDKHKAEFGWSCSC